MKVKHQSLEEGNKKVNEFSDLENPLSPNSINYEEIEREIISDEELNGDGFSDQEFKMLSETSDVTKVKKQADINKLKYMTE